MSFTKTSLVSLAAISFACSASADDVMVDLSVLNHLSSDSYVEVEPLFPVLPKQTQKSVKSDSGKLSTPKAKQITKTPKVSGVRQDKAASKPKIEHKKIEVVDVEPVSVTPEVKPVVELPKPKNNLKTETVIETSKTEIAPKAEEVIIQAPKPEIVTEKEPVIEADNIEVAPKTEVIIEAPKPEVVSEAKVMPEVSEIENIETLQVDNSIQNIEAKANEKVAESALITETPQEEAASAVVNSVVMQDDKTDNKNELLIDNQKETVAESKPKNILVFGEDDDELNSEQEKQIDEIISSFKNEKNNKIAVYSYNEDDGVDSFRRKRICLNRAISVRSYLLRKGFKNFSIKVVNTAKDSGKRNKLKLKEI